MRFTYSKTPSLTSKPKDQRSIIADVLLKADKPMSLAEIVAEVKKYRYEETFKPSRNKPTVEESVRYHLDKMVESQTVKISN